MNSARQRRLAQDLVTLVFCWLSAYGLGLCLARVRGTDETLSLTPYLVALPAILLIWSVVALAVSIAMRTRSISSVAEWSGLAVTASISAVAAAPFLRAALPQYHYSQPVILVFMIIAVLALGLSRQFPAASMEQRAQYTAAHPRASSSPATLLLVCDLMGLGIGWVIAYTVASWKAAGQSPPVSMPTFAQHLIQFAPLLFVWIAVFACLQLYDQDYLEEARQGWQMVGAAVALAGAGVWVLRRTVVAYAGYPRLAIVGFVLVGGLAVVAGRTLLAPRLQRAEDRGRRRSRPLTRLRVATEAKPAAPQRFTLQHWKCATVASWAMVMLLFNIAWYVWFLSFPLFGEDGAANYSFLVEAFRDSGGLSVRFPIKWLEGLGQPNIFVSVTFDPFSWLMLLPANPAHMFRISYALRATIAWLAAYLFVVTLFRRAHGLALAAASLYMLITFTLTHPWGNPTFASMFNATHAAIFPALLAVYLRGIQRRRLLGWTDAAMVAMLAAFFLVYPLGSLLGLAALEAFALALLVAARRPFRGAVSWALLKLGIITAAILFMPVVGLFRSWWAVAAVSARHVFAGELTTYTRQYMLPHFWHDVPAPLGIVVLLAVFLVLLPRRWPPPLRAVALATAVVVGGSQLATFARAYGVAADFLERVPRPFYAEYYIAVFYALMAAYVLCSWRRIRPARPSRGSWVFRVAIAGVAAWILIGPSSAVGLMVAGIALLDARRESDTVRVGMLRWAAMFPAAAIAALYVATASIWQVWPEAIHSLFAAELVCHRRSLVCQDRPGPSMGAAATPITDFLRGQLSGDQVFRGRADFAIMPPLQLKSFPIDRSQRLTAADFNHVRDWYVRVVRGTPGIQVHSLTDVGVRSLISAMHELTDHRGLPEDVVLDIIEWATRHPDRATAVRVVFEWLDLPEIAVMVQERERNFLATGNGMLLRALPFQGIPVASSYEQTLDYLYYLMWTRYVNEGVRVRHSFNFTSLLTIRPERLALLGVRYVVARDVPLQAPPALPRVFGWRRYSIYEVPGANMAGYGPARVVVGTTLGEELSRMRAPGFDPATTVVVGREAEIEATETLAQLAASQVRLQGQTLVFEGWSAGRTVAVLPFKFSHCWQAEWEGASGRVIRADVALLGIAFERATRVRLMWTAGYGPQTGCLRADRRLISQTTAITP